MIKRNCWQVVPAVLTLALVACEQSITSVAAPVVEFQAAPPLTLGTTGACVVPDLISRWPGDGTFDDIAGPLDAANNIGFNSVNGWRTAELNDGDVTFESGLVGQAFSFTPITGAWEAEFIEIPDAVDLQPAEFTIDLWARRTGDGQNADDAYGNVLIQKAINDRINEGISYSIWWNGAGIIKAGVNLGGVLSRLENGVASVADEWVHIALTVDGSTSRLYVNGAEVAEAAGGTPVYGGGSVVIGSTAEFARAAGWPRGFHGLIDEVEIFGSALGEPELRNIFENGRCNNAAPNLNEITGDVIEEGDVFVTSVSFTDDDSESWDATINYGDDSPVEMRSLDARSFELSHVYSGNGSGPFTVRVTVNDGTASGMGTAQVTVVYPLTIHQATVKLDRRRRRGKDTYDVDGRLPLSLLERFDPDYEDLTVTFAGVEGVISADSFVRKDHKWQFKASRRASGVQRMDLHDDGRFKIQARGPYSSDLHTVNFSNPVEFSLWLGSDISVASIQLDRRLYYGSRCGGECHDDDDDDDDDDGDNDIDDDDDDEDDDDDDDDRVTEVAGVEEGVS